MNWEHRCVVDSIFYDRLERAGIVTETLFKAILCIAQVQVAGVDEVHREVMVVLVKNDYGGGVKVMSVEIYISDA